jgi:hypothetical protein
MAPIIDHINICGGHRYILIIFKDGNNGMGHHDDTVVVEFFEFYVKYWGSGVGFGFAQDGASSFLVVFANFFEVFFTFLRFIFQNDIIYSLSGHRMKT